jgi:hypothetical protein
VLLGAALTAASTMCHLETRARTAAAGGAAI